MIYPMTCVPHECVRLIRCQVNEVLDEIDRNVYSLVMGNHT